jgi:glycosyltransferase involved in cell wall biosynthesis
MAPMTHPLLSVIVTNYNDSVFLEERLKSILEQLGDDGEIVIVDDGSTDNSVAIIKRIMQGDPRVRLIEHPHNLGVIPSVNRALREAKGLYVASFSVDDLILPGCIEETLSVLIHHPHIAVCCSDCASLFDGVPGKAAGSIEVTPLLPAQDHVVILPPPALIEVLRTSDFWIPGHTSIVKRESLIKYGGFREKLEHLCDWFLLHTIALQEGAAYIPKTLSVWRHRGNNYSATHTRSKQHRQAIHRQLFIELSRQESRALRRAFARSTLLRSYVKSCFWFLLGRPRYWDFLVPAVRRFLSARLRKMWRATVQ